MPSRLVILVAALAATLVLTVAAAEPAGDAAKPDAEGFISLFSGKDLVGWTVRSGTAAYKAEDACIVGTTVEGSSNTFLCTDKEYGDFELLFEVKCDPALNSGVQIRSHAYEKDTVVEGKTARTHKAGRVYGLQCEIAGSPNAGNFYDEARRGKMLDDFSAKPDAQKAYKAGEWNSYRIVAKGDHIQSWINGIACADFKDAADAKGFIGLQVHGIAKGKGPYEVRWRNLRLRELK